MVKGIDQAKKKDPRAWKPPDQTEKSVHPGRAHCMYFAV